MCEPALAHRFIEIPELSWWERVILKVTDFLLDVKFTLRSED